MNGPKWTETDIECCREVDGWALPGAASRTGKPARIRIALAQACPTFGSASINRNVTGSQICQRPHTGHVISTGSSSSSISSRMNTRLPVVGQTAVVGSLVKLLMALPRLNDEPRSLKASHRVLLGACADPMVQTGSYKHIDRWRDALG